MCFHYSQVFNIESVILIYFLISEIIVGMLYRSHSVCLLLGNNLLCSWFTQDDEWKSNFNGIKTSDKKNN